MSEAAWMAEHKGPLKRIEGAVWWCGDLCDCQQARIAEVYENKTVPGAVVRVPIWEGAYYIDGDGDAFADLETKREELRSTDPDLEALIKWPERQR
jgi:hypothetical protein